MKKRIQKSLCALLALIMLLSIVPVSSVSAAPAGDRLDGWNETIYNFLKTNVAAVANGDQASTEFTLSDTNGIMKWSKEDLGVSTLISGNAIAAEAQAALTAKFNESVDLDAIMNSLMADCPYDLYWYDKVTGVSMSYSMSVVSNEMKITRITFKLAVCQEYAVGQYTVDTDAMKSVASITDNAMAIVEKHADKSDWDKLVAYKDEICDLVSYNHAAADSPSTPYGNPWQLIYVFDMDSSTNVVCEGYAKAFKLLCDLTSFEGDVYCYTVTGYMQGGTGAGDHMWNVVDINGGRLMADVTNCDAGTIGAPDQLFLTAGSKYGDSYSFPAGNSTIYYTYDPDEYGLYTDGYLELTPVPEQEEDPEISTEPTTPIDPLAIKFDEIVGYCDTFYESIPWYVVCKLSWDLVDWDYYEEELPVLQIPAAEYEAAAAKYCVLTESMLNAIRNETDYEGNPIYDPETNTYTVFFVGGWGGFLHNRVYAGYVKTGEDTYDVYYMTINYEFLDEILPDGTTVDDLAGDEWPEVIEYGGYEYRNGPDGYFRIAGYSKSGIKYGVKYDGENVMIATRTPYSVGQQPDDFDDITIEDILTYEIVEGEAIITDCADTFSGEITIPNTLGGYPVTTIGEFAFAHLTNPISVNTGNSVKTINNAAFLGCYGLESVTLGDNVQSVDEKAFEACDNLQSFAVSANNANFSSVNGVLYNKNQTVLLCAPKTVSGEFTIPGGVLTVGEYAFDGCMSLTDLVVGNDVTTIGKRAFNNCMNLASVKLGSSVKTIDEYAFMNCSRINKLIAPLSLTDIKDHAFERCTGLADIYYAGTQSQWIAINIGGNNEPIDNATIHYESDGSAPADPWYLSYEIVNDEAVITGCDSSISGSLELPATLGGYPVTTIAMNAFRFSQITDITLPETTTTLEGNAFAWSAIRGIYIPAGVHTINSAAFQGCTDFTGYTVSPDNPYFSSDGYGVLFNKPMTELISAPCTLTGTYYVPNTVNTLPTGSFMGCEKLENLYIPQSVTNMGVSGGSFFKGCTNLQGVWVDPENTAYRSDEYGALLSKDNWYLYFVPNTLSGTYRVPDGVVYVDHAFDECAQLTGIYFPEGVGNISADFSQCISLKRLYIPASLSTMNFRLYELYEYQADIYYAGTLEQWDCIYSLDSDMHPGNLNIMYNCDPAIWDLSWYISDGGAYINDCNENATGIIIVPDTLNGYPVIGIDPWAFQDRDGITEVHLPVSVTYIGMNAFAYCDNLTTVTMSGNVSVIGTGAFMNCTSLTAFEIPEDVGTIEDTTFYGCTSLTNVTIRNGVAVIGASAFNGCGNLADVYYTGTENEWNRITFGSGNDELLSANVHFADPLYLIYEIVDGEAIITGCDPSVAGTIDLPSTLGGYPVTAIGYRAFYCCTEITEVYIANGVISIGKLAFEQCSKLEKVNIPGSVTSIGDRAFFYNTSLTQINIPDGVTTIGERAFCDCTSLTDVTIGDSVREICSLAFEDCCALEGIWVSEGNSNYSSDAYGVLFNKDKTKLIRAPYTISDSYKIPDSVITIGEYAFCGCEKLTNLVLPDGLKEIENHAFVACRRMSINGIPDSVQFIGKQAFSHCTALESVIIPEGVTSIEELTFRGCTSLRSVKLPISLNVIHTEAFYNCSELCDVYYSGTQAQWTRITISDGNDCLTGANVHCVLETPVVKASNAVNGVKITWNAISGAKSYNVYKSVNTGGKWSSWTAIKTGVTGTTYTDTSVKSNDNVKYMVRAVNGSHLSDYEASSAIKFLAAPTVTVSNATNGVKITWNAISGAKDYKVYKSVYSGGKWSGWTAIKTGVTGTTYTDTSVKSNDNVKYTIRAFNGSYSSTYKASSSIKFLATPTVTVSNATNGVKISWNKITGAKTYTVYKSTYTNGAWSGWKAIKTGVTGTTYTDTTVKSNDNVRYTAKAINGNFTSYIKASSSIKFLATPTVKVANAAKGVTVTWNKIAGAKTYTVYRSVYSGGKWSGWTAIKTGVTGTSYTDTAVKSGATVRYTVKAINGSFTSYIKASATTKFLTQPTVKVAKATNGIKASWGKVTGATGYIVYRRTYSNGKWSGWTQIKTTTALSFTDTTAKKGVTYQYTVRAYSGSYKSSYTNSTSIKR